MAGALFIWMADWYGRTWHMFFGCFGVCLATIITAMSINLPMLIAGRFFLSFFATCAHTAAPLYLVEITPAAYRGTLAGLYNTFYNVVSQFVAGVSCIYVTRLTKLPGINFRDISRLCQSQVSGASWRHRLEATSMAPDGLSSFSMPFHQVLPRIT